MRRLVKRLVDGGDASQRGLVHQALASAITDVELTEYYKFLAMMQVRHACDPSGLSQCTVDAATSDCTWVFSARSLYLYGSNLSKHGVYNSTEKDS